MSDEEIVITEEIVVTAVEAAHVLHHYGEGGYQPGGFVADLIGLMARADPTNLLLLGIVYPGYAAAVCMIKFDPDGIEQLRRLAGAAR
jgi:hypothetical protein